MYFFKSSIIWLFISLSGLNANAESNSTIRNADGSLRPIYEIMNADRETLNSWIQEAGDVNHEDEGDGYHQGGTALMWAAVLGKKDLVEYLIQQGASIDQEIMQTGETALMAAVRNGKKETVELLIRRGANVNHVNKRNKFGIETPLSWAVLHGDKDIAKLLLDNGARLRGSNGTELITAVTAGYTEIVKLLIQRGADLNGGMMAAFRLNCSYTPLHFATENGNVRMVELLLQNGADHSLKNCDGNTALHIAAGLETSLDSGKIVENLLRNGANRSLRNEFGQTPLDIATDEGNTAALASLSVSQRRSRLSPSWGSP